jgi:hypothetical protein
LMTMTTTATVMISAQTTMIRARIFSICLDSPLTTNPLLCSRGYGHFPRRRIMRAMRNATTSAPKRTGSSHP